MRPCATGLRCTRSRLHHLASIHCRDEVFTLLRIDTPLCVCWLSTGWHSDTLSKIRRPFKNASCANNLGSFGEQGCVIRKYLNDHVLEIPQTLVSSSTEDEYRL